MSQTGSMNEKEKIAKIRRKSAEESKFHQSFATVRYPNTLNQLYTSQAENGLLQRQCNCGKHTIAGGTCEECQQKQEAGLLQRTNMRPISDNVTSTIVQESLVQPLSLPSQPSPFNYDFSQVPIHASATTINRSFGLIQRDLATPEPEVPAPAQPDLTDAQIRAAIRYNRQFYDESNTRLIQDLLGGPITGSFTPENIRSIAAIQETHNLKKDGKVGPNTFKFIEQEQTLEGASTNSEDCLTMFRPMRHPVQVTTTPGPGGTTFIRGHHVIEARFSSRCNCSEFQYRQFITGMAIATRGAATQDLSNLFSHIPGGRLPASFQEDGNTSCPSQNYGHREQPGQARTTTNCGEDHYMDDSGTTDQANGCVYRGEDFPQITVSGLQTGDTVDLVVEFRGEIQRNGTTVQTRRWTDIDETATTP